MKIQSVPLRGKQLVLGLIAALALAGCSTWMGESEDPPLPGKRVAIMLMESDLDPAPELENVPVPLPDPWVNADWPQSGGHPSHAMHHLAAEAPFEEAWSVSFGDGGGRDGRVLNGPVVADGRIFTVDADYQVRAFNAETGKRLWQVQAPVPSEDGDAFGGGLAYENGRLFLSTGYARLHAFTVEDGQALWEQSLSAPARAAPAVAGGVVVVVTVNNQTVGVEAETGRRLWNHVGFSETAGLIGGGVPALDGGMAVVPYSSGEVYALHLGTGQVMWGQSLSAARRGDSLADLADIRSSPVIDRGAVFVLSHAGRMGAFDLRRGAALWQRRIGGVSTPWVAGDALFVLANNGHVAGLNRTRGRAHWLTSLPVWEDPEDKVSPISWTGPILAGGRLVLANSQGELWVLSPETGEVLATLDVGGSIHVAPIVANGTLYVQTGSGSLVALR